MRENREVAFWHRGVWSVFSHKMIGRLGFYLLVASVFCVSQGCATALPPEVDESRDTGMNGDSDSETGEENDSADTASESGNTDSGGVDSEEESDLDTEAGLDSETGPDMASDTEPNPDTETEEEGNCGDGIVFGIKETCDGDGLGNGGETALCDLDCTKAECGDKTVNPTSGEFCDDGNAAPDDGCDAECHKEGMSLGESSVSPVADDTYANGDPSGGSCNDGSVAIGFFGAAGQWFDIFGVQCGALDSTFRLTGETHDSATVGSSGGGTPFGPLICPDDQLLVAVTFDFNNHFRSAEGHCRSAAAIYSGAENTSWTSNTETASSSTNGSYPLERATIGCDGGSVVTGVEGYDVDYPSGYPSSIRLVCRKMAP